MAYHNTISYLLDPQHKVTVDLIGLGGTGSQVLTMLGRMDSALRALGHPGLHVRGWDFDTVEQSNMGRQLFSPSDLGVNKAVCLVTRINRFFGQNWEAWPQKYESVSGHKNEDRQTSNITITCVDTIRARKDVSKKLYTERAPQYGDRDLRKAYYWMDFGNTQKMGQVVLATVGDQTPPDNQLPTVFELFPDFQNQKDEDSGPSCSMAEALGKQDLFINSTLANVGMAILWKLFREGRISSQGAFLNLETLSLSPINL
jgi:PRTRC genetic system ThiF family protein